MSLPLLQIASGGILTGYMINYAFFQKASVIVKHKYGLAVWR